MSAAQKKPLLYVFIDTETYNVDGGVEPYFIGYKTNLEPEGKVFFDGVENVGTKFCAHMSLWNRHYSIVLVAFNIQFDLLAIYPTILKPLKNSKFELITTDTNKFISSCFKSDAFNFECLDLWIWDSQMSLGRWRDKLGMSAKGSVPYNKNTKVWREGDCIHYLDEKGLERKNSYQDEENYLRGDVEAMPHILKSIEETKTAACKLMKISQTHKMTPTVPSFCKFLVNACMQGDFGLDKTHQIFDETFRPEVDFDTYHRMQRSSSGGYTAHNKDMLAFDGDNIETLDINSCYPHILYGLIPFGEVLDSIPEGAFNTWHVCTMTECSFIEKYKCISKLLTPKRWLTGEEFYCDSELFKRIKKVHHSNIKIVRTLYQKVSVILQEEIAVLFDRKNNTKEIGEKNMVKLMLNGQYGKMLEKTHLKQRVYDGVSHVLWYTAEYKASKKRDRHTLDLSKKTPEEIAEQWQKEIDSFKKPLRSCMTGVFVVHRAKCRLIDAITSEIDQGNTFLYCDTDSIKFVANVPHVQHEDPKELGAWKHEGTFTNFRCIGKDKKYYLFNKHTEEKQIKLSGVSNHIVSFLKKHMTHKNWCSFFDKKNNYIIFDGKKTRTHKSKLKFGQIRIESHNFEMNRSIGNPTHSINIDLKRDKLIICILN